MQPISDRATGADARAEEINDVISRYSDVRRSVVARSVAAIVAVASWLGPVQISWQAARQSAATIALHTGSPFEELADRVASWRTTGRLLVRWGVQHADAAPITDPTAPIRFTPTITQTTGPNTSWVITLESAGGSKSTVGS